MSRLEVAAVALPYGAVERVDDHATRAAGVACDFEDLQQFGFAPVDIGAARTAWDRVADESAELLTEHRGLGAPALDYFGGRLSRIATDHHCKQLTLAGRPVYESDGLALLASLEIMDAGEPLWRDETVWFPCLGVTAHGFYGNRGGGTLGVLNANDHQIRHLILEAYQPVSDATPPVPITFLCSGDDASPATA